ncbi:hypothetical protein, partial [Massilia genomosp. 1]|uniref:hypothetical protein n=1 Tax=Massilia genomosp. 1 TaxID=2609280 RepID=UPI001C9E8D22
HGVGVLIKLQKLNHARNGRPLPPFRLRCQAIFIRSASFARGSVDCSTAAEFFFARIFTLSQKS